MILAKKDYNCVKQALDKTQLDDKIFNCDSLRRMNF